ncbi:hypothetical protein EPUS_07725 [Endocarpon pusillum Z07020]|uniref:Uncharacterized protein n=1 Tax=Endocarpon pusillum (strain Z07020 / HMAS-L-300199) TaxID=1263415 RepID=U1HSJ4_ENDPU|nr:uncharacterized protein EPUS_07725 [Endocarpon pusillum Z07020]ERF73520.1 hypothetical protein EPUS_07725 [Endocarpon pusillum Z07020]
MSNPNDLTPVFTKDACPRKAAQSGPPIFLLHSLTPLSSPTPPAGPYSQAIRAASQIWVAGQIPADSEGKLIEGSMAEKTAMCCRNVKAVLEAAGSDIEKVVRVGVFLTDMKDFAEMNAEYEKWFTQKPARTCVAVHQLPKGVPVEIEAIALQ